MLIVGALGLLYAFIYCSGSVAELSMALDKNTRTSDFTAAEGLYDANFLFENKRFQRRAYVLRNRNDFAFGHSLHNFLP